MAKVHFHYKHIIVLFLFILCFSVLAFIIIHDVFSNKDISEKSPANLKDTSETRIRDSRDDITIQDVLRSPVMSRDDVEPALGRIEVIRERYEPIRERVEPIRERIIQPTRERSEPTQGRIEPIRETSSFRIEPPSIKIADPTPRGRAVEDLKQAISNELHTMHIEEDALDALSKFVQSKQQNRLPRVSHEDYYVAAVVDFQPMTVGDILTKVRWNVDQYLEIISNCEKYMVDVIVFPELGIFSVLDTIESVLMIAPQVPSVQDEVVPCDVREYDEILTKLSCAAKMNKMYVSATIIEKYCIENTTCSIANLRIYLTTLVFDRNGKIIAKYRKHNLYIERFNPGINVPLEPELVTFTSDFNVTFGVITGFDIFFKDPAVSLTRKYNVTDIIFPNSLPIRLPFLAVSSVAAGWSYVMDVNVLSSKNTDLLGVAGNNIFFGRREFTQTYITDHGFSSIVIAPVPKLNAPFPRDFANTYPSLMKYSNRNFPISQLGEHILTSITMEPLINADYDRKRQFKYINKDFFCNISITWEPSIETFGLPGYRMAGFNGVTNYTLSSINNYVEMCGLILCSSLSDFMCMLPALFDDSSKVIITSMTVTAASRLAVDDIRIPITLSSDYTVLDPSNYKFSNVIKIVDGERYNIAEISLKKPTSNLIGFGIYKFPDKNNPAINYGVLDHLLNTNALLG